MQNRILIGTLCLLAALTSLAGSALAQGSTFPPTLPDNSVYGRLGVGNSAGPGQAISIPTLRSRLLGTANVRGVSPTDTGYGGVCNSSTASTANLAAFVAAAAASPVVFIPANCTYYMDATTLPAGLRYLYGQGGQGSSIIRQPDGQNIGDFSYLAYSSAGLVVEGLTIESQRVAAHGKRGLFLSGASFVRIVNVEFKSGVCLGVQNSDSITIEDSHCSSRTNRGISGEAPPSSNIVIKNFRISDGIYDSGNIDQGIIFDGVNGLDIEGGYINFTNDGLGHFTGSNAIVAESIISGGAVVTRAQNIRIRGVRIDSGSVEPIVCRECNDFVISNNIINGPSADNGIGAYANDSITGPNLDTNNGTIANNVLNNVGSAGVVVNWGGKARNIAVTGNTVRNPGRYMNFSGGDGSWGISINGDSKVQVVGNYVRDDYSTTSSSSVTVPAGTGGTVTFTGVGTTLPFAVGDGLRAVSRADPTNNWISGTVQSYTGAASGTLVVLVTGRANSGAGTYTDWNIGQMQAAIREGVGADGSSPADNRFADNLIDSATGGLYGRLIISSNPAIEGGTIVQPASDPTTGGLTIVKASLAESWRMAMDGASVLSFRYDGNSWRYGFTNDGRFVIDGTTSGQLAIKPQATAGTPTWTAGTNSGTPAVTASAPLALSTSTGNLTITGAAGQVLAGSTPAFTATPTLGASGTLGSITFGNATSGLITLQPVTGALGTVTLSMPAATDTLVGKATTDELTNKTLTSSVGKGTWTASGTWTLPALTLGGAITYGGVTLSNAVTGTGNMVLSAGPTLTGTVTGDRFVPASSTVPTNGLYLAGANNPALAANSTKILDWTSTVFTVNATLAIIGGSNLDTIELRSNNAGSFTAMSFGRTSSENYIGISGGSNQLTNGSAAGDLVVRASTNILFTGDGGTTASLKLGGANTAIFAGYVQTGTVAVGSLPTCNSGTKGARHFVTDSNAASFTAGIGAVVAAGGSTNVPVTCDGTNWRIG